MKRAALFTLLFIAAAQTTAQSDRMAFSTTFGIDALDDSGTQPPATIPTTDRGRRRPPGSPPAGSVGNPQITTTAPAKPPPTYSPGDKWPGKLTAEMRSTPTMRSRVWKKFITRFNQCAPGCHPIRYNADLGRGYGCHAAGAAIDMFGMKCHKNGKWTTHMAINSKARSGPIYDLTVCMVGKKPIRRGSNLRVKNGLGCLWHNGSGVTSGHKDHVHFSIGCGGGQW